MLCRVTMKYRSLPAVRPLNNPRNFGVDRATPGTSAKCGSVNILLAVVVAASRAVRPARRTVFNRVPVKCIPRLVEVAYLLMLDFRATHYASLNALASSFFGK